MPMLMKTVSVIYTKKTKPLSYKLYFHETGKLLSNQGRQISKDLYDFIGRHVNILVTMDLLEKKAENKIETDVTFDECVLDHVKNEALARLNCTLPVLRCNKIIFLNNQI